MNGCKKPKRLTILLLISRAEIKKDPVDSLIYLFLYLNIVSCYPHFMFIGVVEVGTTGSGLVAAWNFCLQIQGYYPLLFGAHFAVVEDNNVALDFIEIGELLFLELLELPGLHT